MEIWLFEAKRPMFRGLERSPTEWESMYVTDPNMIDETTSELVRLYRQIKAEEEEIMRLEREMRALDAPELKHQWLDARQRRRDHNVELLRKLVELQI